MKREKMDNDTASEWNATNRGNQEYSAWLHWIVSSRCNLACDFCIAQQERIPERKTAFQCVISSIKKMKKIPELGIPDSAAVIIGKLKKRTSKSPDAIDVESLLRALDEANRVFRIGFSGGEPFLLSNFIGACVAITKKHYISLNTNLTSSKLPEFCNKIDPTRVVHFHASAHFKELERLNLMDRYISNFLMCRERGFNVFAREVAYPPYLAEVEKYKAFFRRKGIDLTFGPYIGEYEGKKYPLAYTEKEIEMFGLDKTSDSDTRHFWQKGKLCNDGYNVAMVEPDGDIRTCMNIPMGNIYSGIKFRSKLVTCPSEFCVCPLKSYDEYLLEKAVQEVKPRGGRHR